MELTRFIKHFFWLFLICLIVIICCAFFDGNIDLNWYEWLLSLIILIGIDVGIISYTEESWWTMKDIINKFKKH